MIVIRTGRLEVPPLTGPRTVSDTHFFDRLVEGCWVALRGYWLRYEDGDHHVRTIGVELEAGLQDLEQGPGVVVEGTLLLDDKNGDDPFSGLGGLHAVRGARASPAGGRRRRPRARAGHGDGTGAEGVRFSEHTIGGPHTEYLPTQRMMVPFAFPAPVETAHALLRSFHLQVTAPDAEVKDVAVVLTTHFDPAQSATSGEVEVEFQRTDRSDAGLWLQSEAIEAQIRILVVGI